MSLDYNVEEIVKLVDKVQALKLISEDLLSVNRRLINLLTEAIGVEGKQFVKDALDTLDSYEDKIRKYS